MNSMGHFTMLHYLQPMLFYIKIPQREKYSTSHGCRHTMLMNHASTTAPPPTHFQIAREAHRTVVIILGALSRSITRFGFVG